MKLSDLLETPLVDIEYHKDDFSLGSFSEQDRKLIKKYIEGHVYREKLKSLPFDLYVYIVDDLDLELLGTDFPEGEITKDDIENGFFRTISSEKLVTIDRGTLGAVMNKVLLNRKQDRSGVHFILGDNNGGTEQQIGLTPWMLVHRLVHALVNQRESMRESIDFREMWRNLHKIAAYHSAYRHKGNILAFKSAKSNKTSDYELATDCFTELLLTGDLRIDSSILPQEDLEKIENYVIQAKAELKELIPKLRGRIYYI